MSLQPFSIQPYQGKRVRVATDRQFDDVLSSLRKSVPPAIPPAEFPAAMQRAGELNLETFEKVVQSRVGASGFMLFGEFDYSTWLPFYGVPRKAIRLILGNPLIAITMVRHEIEAALFAPVELLLVDNQGGGSTVVYDLPSALMVVTDNPPLLAAAEILDEKLEALVREAT